MPRYVPPALRRQSNTGQGSRETFQSGEARQDADIGPASRSLADLALTQSKIKKSRRDQIYTAREIRNRFWPFAQNPFPDSDSKSERLPHPGPPAGDAPRQGDASKQAVQISPDSLNPTTQPQVDSIPTSIKTVGTFESLDPNSPWHRHLPASTLNNSIHITQSLAYVMLFPGANPRWDSDRLVFAKSNLELLPPGDEQGEWFNDALFDAEGAGHAWALDGNGALPPGASAEPLVDYDTSDEEEEAADHAVSREKDGQASTKTETVSEPPAKPSSKPTAVALPKTSQKPVGLRAVPVFEQRTRGHRSFRFVGHWHVKRIAYLAPHSADLVRMLEHKFTAHKHRTGDAWQASLDHCWAVINLVPSPILTKAPKIEVGGCETHEELAKFKAFRERRKEPSFGTDRGQRPDANSQPHRTSNG